MGDLDAAYLTMEHARQLEDSDRFDDEGGSMD